MTVGSSHADAAMMESTGVPVVVTMVTSEVVTTMDMVGMEMAVIEQPGMQERS